MRSVRQWVFRLVGAGGVALGLALGACSQPQSVAPVPASSTNAVVALSSAPLAAPMAAAPHGEDDDDLVLPPEKFTEPEKAFAVAKDALLHRYYAAGLTDEDLYRAAVQGMLANVDPRMHKWNKLLSPQTYAELTSDLQGQIIGIGVKIKHDAATGHLAILGTVPGSPAEKAGLHATDTILSVNGKLFKGKSEREVVNEIRGKVGEVVTLSVLRDDKILPFTITRAVVAFEAVTHAILDGVGYVSVHMFSEKTTPALKAALDDFAAARVRGIALDLRENMGGSFDEAVRGAELFLPAGTPIVTVEHRDGKKDTTTSKGAPAQPNVPVVVLIDHKTASGAELMTGALSEGRHAKTVGARTYGKWTVQTIDELGNGYAIKYTMALFLTPSGKSYDGVGLVPDVEVDADPEQMERAMALPDVHARVAADAQLRTALSLVAP